MEAFLPAFKDIPGNATPAEYELAASVAAQVGPGVDPTRAVAVQAGPIPAFGDPPQDPGILQSKVVLVVDGLNLDAVAA